MKYLRNKEVRNSLILFICATLFLSLTALVIDFRCAVFVFICGLIFTFLHLYITSRRYKKIAALSSDIDKLLHGDISISFSDYSEGELSILQSEIHKMTVRLTEQRQNLIKDKVYLADSIADISHQIRTPLTSINLLVSLLSSPDITAEHREEILRELSGLLSRIDWLITSLLKISKLDAGTVNFIRDKITLGELIGRALSPMLIPMELKQQECTVKAEGNFTGDLQWTSEALTNIIKNCTEHTPEGGKILITAAENPLYTEIIIKDNGTGIDESDLPHIFERFYKGHNSDSKSFGIGLALSRMIITGQNGTVKAANAKEGGAEFTVRFYKSVV